MSNIKKLSATALGLALAAGADIGCSSARDLRVPIGRDSGSVGFGLNGTMGPDGTPDAGAGGSINLPGTSINVPSIDLGGMFRRKAPEPQPTRVTAATTRATAPAEGVNILQTASRVELLNKPRTYLCGAFNGDKSDDDTLLQLKGSRAVPSYR